MATVCHISSECISIVGRIVCFLINLFGCFREGNGFGEYPTGHTYIQNLTICARKERAYCPKQTILASSLDQNEKTQIHLPASFKDSHTNRKPTNIITICEGGEGTLSFCALYLVNLLVIIKSVDKIMV